MRNLCCIALLAVGAACQARDTSAAAKAAIDATNADWARLSAAGHADSIADFYSPNAVLMPPNMAPVRGAREIRAFFAQLNMSTPPSTLTLRADSVWASGPAAVEVGRWHYKWGAGAPRPPGVPEADSGKYIVRWVNENGRWLMVQDVWNSDLPMPTAPAAPRR